MNASITKIAFGARKITLIAAMSLNRMIGKNNQLPWQLPNDLKYFKDQTLEKTLLMGRKTFESIGRPLPKRKNMVLTRQTDFSADGIEVVHSLDQLITKTDPHEDIMIIGGAEIYQLLLPYAQKILLTEVQAEIDGDAFFPEIDNNTWHEVSREVHCRDENHAYDYAFVTLTRN